MTSIPEDDPGKPCEGDGVAPREHPCPAARRPTFESIFDALGRELDRPLSEVIRQLSVQGKARMLDMLLARMEEQDRSPKGEGENAPHP